MSKKIIWSLFDSETSVLNHFNENYDVYCIGIGSNYSISEDYVKIDLSKRSCLKKLNKLPKPDIIFASPPCETWVTVTIGNVYAFDRNYNEYNLYWQKNMKGNNYMKKHRKLRLNGQRTAFYTAKIIQEFNPDSWFIENGSSSLIFKYLSKYCSLEGYKNKTYYSAYSSNFPKKPTTIFSNKKIHLRQDSGKTNIVTMHHRGVDKSKKIVLKNYCERSRVPLELYTHILDIVEGGGQLSMFN